MQTFLPYSNFTQTASCLDNKRLGKQRVEAKQILKINLLLTASNKYLYIPWENHPAVLMWRGYELCLAFYGFIICSEWRKRGFIDNQLKFFVETGESLAGAKGLAHFRDGFLPSDTLPEWLNNRDFHLSHQSNLVRKFPEHYRKYFPDVPNNLSYIWPISKKV